MANRQIFQLDAKTIVSTDVFPVQDESGAQEAKKVTLQNIVDAVPPDASKLNVTDFNTYSGATDTRLDGIESDIVDNTGLINDLSGKTAHYNGKDTKANILALNPSLYLGQHWFAEDTFERFTAYSIATTGNDEWISEDIHYDATTDTFKLDDTADGQTQNLGQEIFVTAFNVCATGATALDPKVFIKTGQNAVNPSISDMTCASAGDIGAGSIYGLNTTEAATGQYFKLSTYGMLNDVNTLAWAVGTTLYVGENGELTDIKPLENAFVVGRVAVQSNTVGKIFVNTIRSVNDIVTSVGANFTTVYFTGDEEIVPPVTGDTYFQLNPNNEGTVASDSITAAVPDNSTVAGSQDLIGVEIAAPRTFNAGQYEGQLTVENDDAGGNERIYCEVYVADSDGNVIDSGISGQTVGDLGVRPIVILSTILLDLPTNTLTNVNISGIQLEPYTQLVGQRIRIHVLFEKVGAAGGTKNMSLWVGSDYASFIKIPTFIALNDLADVDVTASLTNQILKKNASDIWVSSNIAWGEIIGTVSDQTDLQAALDAKPDFDIEVKGESSNYTVQQSDNGKAIECDGTFTVTFPIGLSDGFQCLITNVGTGVITLAADGQLNTKDSNTKISSQWAGVTAYHRGSNNIVAFGDLTA